METKQFYIVFLLLSGLFFSGIAKGQVGRLVSWEGYRDNWSAPTSNPTYYGGSNAYISAGSITGNDVNFAITYGRFQGDGSNGWPIASSPDYSKYIQISISADAGYQILLDRLKFRQNGYCGAYEIRFSKNVAFPSNGTLLNQNTNASATYNQDTEINFPSNTIVASGETLYVRFYGYQKNQYNHPWGLNNSPYNLQSEASNEIGPAFYGEVVSAILPPTATNDNATTTQNFPVDIHVLGNDTYSTLSAITITQQPANGQNITVNGLVNVTYTPNTNYTGTDSFKYTITDENGTSNEATVNVSVNPTVAPTAVADAVSTSQNQSINIDVLANDTPGSGAFDYVTIVTNPAHGNATVNPNNTVAYTPSNDYLGGDSFQYNVTNVHNMTSNTVTVNIDVTYSPEPLVRWNGASNGYNPDLLASNINASNITNHGGGTLTNQGQYSPYFQTGNWPNPSQNGGYLNESRYVQFTLSPVGNYKINLDEFSFEAQTDDATNGANFEVRYSKDFSQGYSSFNGTIGGNSSWGTKSGSLTSVSPVLPGETLYIRLYVYNTYNALRIRHGWGGATGPIITGSVSQITMADLEVTKTVNNPTANVNGNVTFTIEAKNNGPDNATGVVVTDILPNGYQYVSHSAGSYNPVNGQWSIGNLANSASSTLDITAKVLATGNYTNTASIYSNQGDPDMTNNSDSVSVTPVFPDLKISKIVNNVSPNAGSNVTFTITAENLGPADATGVIVTDVLPNGYSYVSSSASQGSYNPTSGKWTIGTLNNTGSVSLDITAKVLATGNYDNTTTIEGQEADPESGNNMATANVVPFIPSADLSITKTIDNPNPPVGGNITYTITVENLGGNATTGVTVTDILPSGFTFVSSTNSPGTGAYNPTTGKWVIGNMAVSASVTLTITVQRKATGVYNNVASVTHDGVDPVPGNDTANANLQLGCETCTHTVSGGLITVNAGETYCLTSGSWTGGVVMNGGTICIASGATFNTGYITGNLNGTVINHGTMTFNLNDGTSHNITFENHGVFNSTNFQYFAGTLNNFGTVQMTSGVATFLSGANVNNYATMTLNNVQANNTNFTNYSNFVVNSNFYLLNGGSFDNKTSATASLNMASGNTEIRGQLDNLGLMEIRNANAGQGISTVVNNYGDLKIYDAAILGSETYLTNDQQLEFINIGSVEFQGPMLQNNSRLRVTAGSLSLNSSISQMVNNGIIIVSGAVSHNIAGSKVVNNCSIVSGSYFVGNGTSENNGLIWVSGEFKVEGALSIIINSTTGFIRGTDFRNSGEISGYGSFYFTGNTNFESAGTMTGDDGNNPILFYDVSQTGNQIFDQYVPNNPPIHVERPAYMLPLDTATYDCSAPPVIAGYPPTTLAFDTLLCAPESILIPLADYVTPHEPVEGNPFTVLYNTVRLFDYTDNYNPTNNTTSLEIPGKGTFTVNTSTGVITFVPLHSFTSGVVEAEYRVSNEWSGVPPIHPSGRTKITITFISIDLPEIDIDHGGSNPLCMDQTLTLSNGLAGGIWSSSNESVATILNGVVTPLSEGTTTISYTVTKATCSEAVTMDVIVQSCTPVTTRKVITNPMLPSKAKRP